MAGKNENNLFISSRSISTLPHAVFLLREVISLPGQARGR